MTSRGSLAIIFVLLAGLFTSCSPVIHNFEITDISLPPKPLFEPLPISVMALYNDRFLTYQSTSKNNRGKLIHNIHLGESSAVFFDYLFKSVFKEVKVVRHSLDAADIPEGIELIVKPSVSKYSYALPDKEAWVTLSYRVYFYLPDKELIGILAVRGDGKEQPRFSLFQKKQQLFFSALTQAAMREIAAKFISRLCTELFVRDKFYQQCLHEVFE